MALGRRRAAAGHAGRCAPRRGIARTFQTPRVIGEASVLQNVMIGGTIEGTATFVEALLALPRHRRDERMLAAKARALLGVVGLEALADVRADRLQHSELRFIEIARALMLDPEFLLLDEPAAGLSSDEIERLGGLIKAISAPRHRRAAGGAPCRPDLRHLRSGHRAQSRAHAGGGHAGRDPRSQGGGQCLPRRLNLCWRSTGCESGYGKIGVLHGVDFDGRGRRSGGAARPERRRQDHPAARAVGIAAGQCRPGALRWPRHDQRHAARYRARRAGACDRRPSGVHPDFRHRQSAAGGLRPAARRARGAGRGSLVVLSRDCRETPRARRRALRRPAADADGRAGPGAPAAAVDARRTLGRPVAGSGRSRAQRHRASCASRAPRCCWSSNCWKRRLPPPIASTRWCRAISCWKRRPARPICRSGSNTPISGMKSHALASALEQFPE